MSFNVHQLTCVNFPFCMLKLSIESFRLVKLLSFSDWIFELENWMCLIWIPFNVDANKSFDSVVTVRSKSYIDSDWMGAWIFCKLLRNSALVMPGHSRNNPVNGIGKLNWWKIFYASFDEMIIKSWIDSIDSLVDEITIERVFLQRSKSWKISCSYGKLTTGFTFFALEWRKGSFFGDKNYWGVKRNKYICRRVMMEAYFIFEGFCLKPLEGLPHYS